MVMTPILALGDVEPVAELLKCLAHPPRRMIVYRLGEGEFSIAELECANRGDLARYLSEKKQVGSLVSQRT